MSFSTMKGILPFLGLSCFIALASGITCHNCQNFICRDKYSNDEGNLADCGDGMYCVKYKTIVWIQDSGEIKGSLKESSVVTRTCQSKKGQKEGCIGWQNNGGVTLKCWCGTDGCNSGKSLKPVVAPVILVMFLGVFTLLFSLHH